MQSRIPTSLQITKLDASKRQLETAIRLYFHSGDPVAIHTLAAAGYNVIRDLVKYRGADRMLIKDQIFAQIKPEKVSEFRALLNAAENFFKHADKDPEGVLRFNPDQSELLILDACNHYSRLSGEWPPMFWLFFSWYSAGSPDVFNVSEEQRRILQRSGPELRSMGRSRFFAEMLPITMQI